MSQQCDSPACSLDPLTTLEGLYPLVAGPKELEYDTSVAQGVTILNNALQQQLADGNDITVFGYSPSSTISSLEMEDTVTGDMRRGSGGPVAT